MKDKSQNITISTWSIVKIILVIVGFLFLYVLRDILGLIFVAIFFATAITPSVSWLQKKKGIPRPAAMLIIYLTLFGVISLIIGFLIPPLYQQFNDITNTFPEYYDQIAHGLQKIQGGENGSVNLQENINGWFESFSGQAGSGLISALSSLFGGIVFLVIVMVIVFYISIEENAINKIIKSTLPEKYQKDTLCLLLRIQNKLSYWLRSELILGAIIAVVTFLFLLPVMPKYALILALFAGMMEFIPYLGPFLSAIPAIFLAFNFGSLSNVIYVVVVYIIIQQMENNFIVPQVMKRSIGLNPIVTIIMIMIGARLGRQFLDIGALGAVVGVFLAIPMATVVLEIFNYFSEKKKDRTSCDIK